MGSPNPENPESVCPVFGKVQDRKQKSWRRIFGLIFGGCPVHSHQKSPNNDTPASNGAPFRMLRDFIRTVGKRCSFLLPPRSPVYTRTFLEKQSELFIQILIEHKSDIQKMFLERLHAQIGGKRKLSVKNMCLENKKGESALLSNIFIATLKKFVEGHSRSLFSKIPTSQMRRISDNYPTGSTIIYGLWEQVISGFHEKNKHYPSPEELKKYEGPIVNLCHIIAEGPTPFSNIIRSILLGTGTNIFTFDNNGQIHIKHEEEREILDRAENRFSSAVHTTEKIHLDTENHFCAALAMIPHFTHIIWGLLGEAYAEIYKKRSDT